MFAENCPRCLSEISPERISSTPKVCDSCGHVVTTSESTVRKQFEKQSLRWVIGSAIAIVLGFMHLVAWGEYSLEVIPLKVSGWLGMISASGQERMAQICLNIKKLDCVEAIYTRQAWSDPNGLIRLGKFQFNRTKYAEAAQTLQLFFSRGGGNDLEVRYVFARALSEIGNVDEASKQFDILLASKPDVLQVTVTQNYVKLLVQHGRLEQALKVLDSVRGRGDSVAMFMESEYKDIAQKLGKKS